MYAITESNYISINDNTLKQLDKNKFIQQTSYDHTFNNSFTSKLTIPYKGYQYIHTVDIFLDNVSENDITFDDVTYSVGTQYIHYCDIVTELNELSTNLDLNCYVIETLEIILI